MFYDRTGVRPIQDVLRYNGVRLLRYVIVNPGYPNPLESGQGLAAQPPSIVTFAPDLDHSVVGSVQRSASSARCSNERA